MVLVGAALCLIAQQYLADGGLYEAWLGRRLAGTRWADLGPHLHWAAAKILGYLVVPVLAWRVTGRPLAALGLRPTRRHLGTYAALLVAVLPVVALASRSPAFLATYPYYRYVARSPFDCVAWELAYALTFVGTEVFFRGFLLFGLERALGAYAIFVSVIPYCMIHFPKPLPEAVGAIGAGVALGTLALLTRSIWGGVAVHVLVAWAMDALAVAQLGW